MPLYDYTCATCAKKFQGYSTIATRDDPRDCPQGHPLERVQVYKVFANPDIQEYLSPVTGKPIVSRAQRKEDLKRSNSVEWEPGMKESFAKTREQDEKKTLEHFETLVEKTAAHLDLCGKFD